MTPREYLDMHHIQWTQERLQVVDYLMNHHIHPTADEVFQGLKDGGSDISRATVFNTLNVLVDKQAIRTLQIEDGVTRFDIDLYPHAHFRCEKCGKIVNVGLTRNASFQVPEGYRPTHTDYFLIGICPECYSKEQK